jgi:hypothetical protein
MGDINALLDEYLQVQWLFNEYGDRMAALKQQIGSMMQDKEYRTSINGQEVSVSKYQGGSKLKIVDLLMDRRVMAAKADMSTFSTSRVSVTRFREWADDHGWSAEEQEKFVAKTGKEIVKIESKAVREEEI